MAILGEIRKHTWLLIVVIGIAMVAFLAGDLFSENSVLRRFFSGDPNSMGTVDGTSISFADYNKAQQNVSNYYKNQGQEISENQAAQQAWNSLVSQKLILKHAEELGMTVSEDELYAYVQERMGVSKEQLKEIEKSNPQQYQMFLSQQDQIKNEILTQKYQNFVLSGLATTKTEAAFQQVSNIQTADVEVGFVPYTALEKAFKVKVSDDEILAYEKKFPKKFDSEALVKLSYVYFPSTASAADENAVLLKMNEFKTAHTELDKINNITDSIESFVGAKNDSVFVSKYSDIPYNSSFLAKDEMKQFGFSQPANDFLASARTGQVGGPFKEKGMYVMLKLGKSKEIVDSIESSHILISYKGTDIAKNDPKITLTKEQAKAKAEQLLKEVEANPAKFAEVATANSNDQGSALKGGNIGWVAGNSQNLVEPYMNFIKTNPTGKIGLVESKFGYHIIKVDGQKKKLGYQLAILAKKIEPSKSTTDKSFNDANKFAQNVAGKNASDFKNVANKNKFQFAETEAVERFTPKLFSNPSYSSDQDDAILKWAFDKNTEAGTSNLFPSSSGDYIVVFLNKKYDKGLVNPDVVRAFVEPILKNEKLTKAVQDKLGKATPASLSKAYNGTLKEVSLTFANNTVEGIGMEPKLVGAAFGIKPGATTKIIGGNTGVFVVTSKKLSAAPKVEKPDFLYEQMNSQLKQRIQQSLVPSLIEAADIKDNRAKVLR